MCHGRCGRTSHSSSDSGLKRYAEANGHTYLDYFSAMVDPQGLLQQDLSEDGLHPNAKGYAVMSPLAEQAIRVALKKRH